jgi:chemotaxis signal transduction protein
VESNGHHPDDERDAVLVQRAAALARPVQPADRGAANEMLVFTVGGQLYAVVAAGVREVLAAPELSRVPGGPPGLLGVANVRGDILPVADTGRLLGTSVTRSEGAQVLVLDGAGPPLGLLVDEVVELRGLSDDDIVQPPSDSLNGTGHVLSGVASQTVVLDVTALLGDHRTFVNVNDDRRADA